jgi:predicted metalloprotease
VGLVLVLLLGACTSDGGQAARNSNSNSNSGSTATTDENTAVPGKTTFGPDDDDAIIRKAVDDVQSFYEQEFPTLYGQPFSPLSGGLFPYGPDNPPPKCGGVGKSDYRDVAQNAFYCPQSDFMAWDTVNLTNDLLDNFGPYTLAIVVAHELGHAIQQRHGILDGRFITFLTEQQADCFAGAYTKHVRDGGSKAFKVTLTDLDNAIGGFLLIRDPVGTDSVNDTSAHGSAFQRINAFEDGLQGGTTKCKSYEDATFNFVPEVFDPGSLDAAQKGNLPFPEVEPLVIANLEGFWTTSWQSVKRQASTKWTPAKINAFDPVQGVTCGNDTKKGDAAVGVAFYCAQDDTLNWDEKKLMPAVYKLGDLAEAVIIATQYSERAQKLAGLTINTADARLQTDCFTGVWVATTKTNEVNKTLPADAQIQLSPGDLDEAVSAFLELSKLAAQQGSAPIEGSAFQHVDAFRAGFFEAFNNGFASGLRSCINKSPAASDSSSSS